MIAVLALFVIYFPKHRSKVFLEPYMQFIFIDRKTADFPRYV